MSANPIEVDERLEAAIANADRVIAENPSFSVHGLLVMAFLDGMIYGCDVINAATERVQAIADARRKA